MNTAEYKPGLWRIGTPGPNGCATVGTVSGLMVAVIAHSLNEPSQVTQAVANASLIAAAPDLLVALTNIVASLTTDDEEGLIEHADSIIAARAAITKATGAA